MLASWTRRVYRSVIEVGRDFPTAPFGPSLADSVRGISASLESRHSISPSTIGRTNGCLSQVSSIIKKSTCIAPLWRNVDHIPGTPSTRLDKRTPVPHNVFVPGEILHGWRRSARISFLGHLLRTNRCSVPTSTMRLLSLRAPRHFSDGVSLMPVSDANTAIRQILKQKIASQT